MALRAAAATGAGALTPFQAFMTALAASIGTGNIAGVATAIVSGGPGALFWIWVYGFVAMAIKFAEAVLGDHVPRSARRHRAVGPDVLPARRIAIAGARLDLRARRRRRGADDDAVHAAELDRARARTPSSASRRSSSGIVIAVLTWLVIIGGIKSIGRAAEKLSPLKVGLYLAGGLIVILVNAARIPGVLALVVREALHRCTPALGIRRCSSRCATASRAGIYANEAGYGTAAVAYGTAQSAQPAQQGLNAVMEVFIVSFVTSTISAMTILLTGVWQSGLTSTAAVAAAFNTVMPTVGGYIVAFCAFLFGYTTLIGWAYYGEQFFEYILGRARDDAVPLDLLPADPVRRRSRRSTSSGPGAT